MAALNQYNCRGSCAHSHKTAQLGADRFTPRVPFEKFKCNDWWVGLNTSPSRKILSSKPDSHTYQQAQHKPKQAKGKQKVCHRAVSRTNPHIR